MGDKLTLYVIRGIFLLICVGIGLSLLQRVDESAWIAIPVSVALGCVVVFVESMFSRSSLRTITAIVFGLLIGFAASALFSPVIEVIVLHASAGLEEATDSEELNFVLQLVCSTLFCYFGVTLLLQTQDRFQFIIPYVEFRPEVKGLRPILVDTSVVLEGHLAPLARAGFFESRLVVPSFVVAEIQRLADSSDARKRKLGTRGLSILHDLVADRFVEIVPFDGDERAPVDGRLLETARSEVGRVLTRDQRLADRADIEGVAVIFLPQVLQAIRPQYDVGDQFEVEVARRGEKDEQGVGYLADGTLVVIDGAANRVGQRLNVEVRQVVPTQAGRILFARSVGTLEEPSS
ncbi:MAG: TRAM domain-containing protein [Planctomycetota bacterium]